MKKIRDFLFTYRPFSYLFVIALVLGVIEFLINRVFGHPYGFIARIFSLLTIYQYGVFVLFLIWVLVLGVAALANKKVLFKEFVFSLIPLIILVVVAEAAFRFTGISCRTVEASLAVQSMYHPDTINRISETRVRSGQLNGYGFRSRDFDFDKKADDFVIVLLGGSLATGAYAAVFDNTPAVYLENHLKDFIRERYKKNLKVYCLAESAADVEDEAFWLFKLGIHLKPDVVVSLTGFNNMHHALQFRYWDFSSGARGFRRPGIKIVQNLGINKITEDFATLGGSKLTKYSAIYRYVKCRWFKEPDPLQRDFEFSKFERDKPTSLVAAGRMVAALEGMRSFCRGNGIRFFVVLQPFASSGPAHLKALPSDGSADNLEQFIYRNMMSAMRNSTADSLLYLDTTAKISDRLDSLSLFADSCHLWDNGFVVLDREIVEYLKTGL